MADRSALWSEMSSKGPHNLKISTRRGHDAHTLILHLYLFFFVVKTNKNVQRPGDVQSSKVDKHQQDDNCRS